MVTVLLCICTGILVFLAADKIKSYFARVTWDDKLIAATTELIEKAKAKIANNKN